MNLGRYYYTLRYLKICQLFYQIVYRMKKLIRHYIGFRYPLLLPQKGIPLSFYSFISKYNSLYGNDIFYFLNQRSKFVHWDDEKYGKLWSYNLNYMDFLHQDNSSFELGRYWINRFIDEIRYNKNGLDSYPIALRGINWIKFISLNYSNISLEEKQKWDASLYAQYKILQDNLEYHLLGNHLLEDAFSLLWAGLYFGDELIFRKAERLLFKELEEQILPDGAHYELSPMYHEILLDRLLDCINVSKCNYRFDKQILLTSWLEEKAILMLGWLETIIYSDGSIPLFNDAANGIAPTSNEIFAYAHRLGLIWTKVPLKESGYRKFLSSRIEFTIDVGVIGPDYIPGHAHADTFNYELRIDGVPFIVDTGISTYNKNKRRQYERGTSAHNTVTLEDMNSSQVWGGFRVAKRATIVFLLEGEGEVRAIHNGYADIGVKHERIFRKIGDSIVIFDNLLSTKSVQGINTIIFSPSVQIVSMENNLITTNKGKILMNGVDRIWLEECQVSDSYNVCLSTHKICCLFTSDMEYSIYIYDKLK